MASSQVSLRSHLRLISALWTIFAVAGMISTVFAFLVLFDSNFTNSGISIFSFNFTTLFTTKLPNIVSKDVQPIIASAVGNAAGSAASGLQVAQSAVSSGLQTAATDAATAVESDLGAMVPKNMTIGLGKVCFGWDNKTTADCHDMPLNISSIIPTPLLEILGSPIRQLQEIENTIVTAVLETARRSLIAGIVLLLLFSLFMLFWEFPNDPWRRAILTPLGFTCLVVPFLVSTVVIFVVQSGIHRKLDDSSLLSVQNGDASTFGLVGLIFSILMFTATVAITMV